MKVYDALLRDGKAKRAAAGQSIPGEAMIDVAQNDKYEAELKSLRDIESIMGGRNGPSIRLRNGVLNLIAERDALRKFAQAVMQSWPEGDVDGGELQDAAVAAGLLIGTEVSESCGEGCQCDDFPATCYRPTPLLTGEKP